MFGRASFFQVVWIWPVSCPFPPFFLLLSFFSCFQIMSHSFFSVSGPSFVQSLQGLLFICPKSHCFVCFVQSLLFRSLLICLSKISKEYFSVCFFFFFLFFNGSTCSLLKFAGQGLNSSLSWSNARSFNPLHWRED